MTLLWVPQLADLIIIVAETLLNRCYMVSSKLLIVTSTIMTISRADSCHIWNNLYLQMRILGLNWTRIYHNLVRITVRLFRGRYCKRPVILTRNLIAIRQNRTQSLKRTSWMKPLIQLWHKISFQRTFTMARGLWFPGCGGGTRLYRGGDKVQIG